MALYKIIQCDTGWWKSPAELDYIWKIFFLFKFQSLHHRQYYERNLQNKDNSDLHSKQIGLFVEC